MSARPELRALTSVRGIAAWAVVLYHIRLSMDWAPQGVIGVLAKGYLAVDFFFLLSGFVIWMAWHERIAADGWQSVPGFLQKRIARIWPLHAVMLSFGVAMAAALALTGRGDPVSYPFAQLPLHYLLVQNWGAVRMLAWNVPAWSISTELFAYLLFPLIAMRADWRRWPTALLIAAAAAPLLALAGAWHMLGVNKLGEFIPQLGLIRCLAEFTSGTAIGALWLRWRGEPITPAILALALAIGLAAAWWAGMIGETLALPAIFAALLLAIALTTGRRGNPLDIAPLHYLGEISYATYLSHYLLWKAFKLALVDDPHAVPAVLIALYLLLVLAASVSLYHLVERPAQRWVNALTFARRRTASA